MEKRHFKIALLGSPGSGKTSIATKLTTDIFYNQTDPTVGASFFTYSDYIQKYNDNYQFDNKIELYIWDTAGQERYKSLVAIYLRNCDVIIVTYDLTNTNYSELNFWLKYIRDSHYYVDIKPFIFLVGCKADLLDVDANRDKMMADTIEKIKYQLPIEKHVFVSSKIGNSVKDLFSLIMKTLIDFYVNKYIDDQLNRNINNNNSNSNDNVNIIQNDNPPIASYRCCY